MVQSPPKSEEDHGGHSHHGHSHTAGSGNLKVAFLLNLTFTVIESAGGLWTNSIAILSDALHDAGDSLSLGLALYLHRLAQRLADARFTYGYRRFSTLGALTTGVVLVIGLGFVAWHSVQRLADPQPVKAGGVMALAVVGILFNGLAAWKLRHSHSLNEKVASWHLLEDTLGWMAVLVSGVVMSIWTVPIVDPLLSLAICAFVLRNVFKNLKVVGLVFLQSAPPGFDLAAFEKGLSHIPNVVNAHHSQTWTVDGEAHVLSTHLVMKAGSDRQTIVHAKQAVHALLKSQAFDHITVDVELEGEDCILDPPSHVPS